MSSSALAGADTSSLPSQACRASAPFISKLYEILNTATVDDCVKWGTHGDSIVVTDAASFAKNVLPRYFKHDNIRSFIRQLNIYGFQRCRSQALANEVQTEGELEFYHSKFAAGRKDLLRHIQRGVPSQKRRLPSDEAGEGDETMDVAQRRADTGAHALSNEMTDVQTQITALNSQLKLQVQSMQSRMGMLIEALDVQTAGVIPLSSAGTLPASTAAPPMLDAAHFAVSAPVIPHSHAACGHGPSQPRIAEKAAYEPAASFMQTQAAGAAAAAAPWQDPSATFKSYSAPPAPTSSRPWYVR